jgi:hypothetical protein
VAHTSLYADDAVVFVAPIKKDIAFLESTLGTFRKSWLEGKLSKEPCGAYSM